MMTKTEGKGIAAKLVGREWGGSGRDDRTPVVVIFVFNLCEFLETEVADSDHAVMTKSRTLYDVGCATGAEYLTCR
jgi:hypothetical protein